MRLLKAFFCEEHSRMGMIIDSFMQMQSDYVNLIASACYPFSSVMTSQSIPIHTLPIEGFPGKRFFPHYKCMEDLDAFGEEEALKLFQNPKGYRGSIQPHSGTQANQIVYNAILTDGDVVLSMDPNSGGHISHKKMAGRNINVVHYGTVDDGYIDYHEIERLAVKHSPKLIIAGGSSYTREIDYGTISKIANMCGAMLMADICHSALFIAAKLHKSVFPYADFVTFTLEKNLRGPQGGIIIYRKNFHHKIANSTFPISQGGPIQSLMLAKLSALEVLNAMDVEEYASNIVSNARIMSSQLKQNKIKLVTGGSDSHMILIDLSENLLDGAEIEQIFLNNKILVNKNLIPKDKKTPLRPSGIRIGVTCITILRYTSNDIKLLADGISQIINHNNLAFSMKNLTDTYNKALVSPIG